MSRLQKMWCSRGLPYGCGEKLINGKIEIDSKVCNHCGRCIGKCPFKIADDSTDMFKIYIGGRWGKKVRMGTTLNELFTKEEALRVIEKAILFLKTTV